MDGMGKAAITSKSWARVHQDGINIDTLRGNQDLVMPKEPRVHQNGIGIDTLDGNQDLVMPKEPRVHQNGIGIDTLDGNQDPVMPKEPRVHQSGIGIATLDGNQDLVMPKEPRVHQNGIGIDTLVGNQDLVMPKDYGLQEDGAGADVVAGERRRLAMREATHTENSLPTTAFKHDNDKKETIGSLLRILSVVFVLCWTDVKFAFGQTDYGCSVVADPVAGKTFMVAITLLAITGGAVGVAFWVHYHRRNPMDVIDEALKNAPSMVRNDPNLEILPAIEF